MAVPKKWYEKLIEMLTSLGIAPDAKNLEKFDGGSFNVDNVYELDDKNQNLFYEQSKKGLIVKGSKPGEDKIITTDENGNLTVGDEKEIKKRKEDKEAEKKNPPPPPKKKEKIPHIPPEIKRAMANGMAATVNAGMKDINRPAPGQPPVNESKEEAAAREQWYKSFKETLEANKVSKDGSNLTKSNGEPLQFKDKNVDLYNLNYDQQVEMYKQCNRGITVKGKQEKDNVYIKNNKDGTFGYEFDFEKKAREQKNGPDKDYEAVVKHENQVSEWYKGFKDTMQATNVPKDGSTICDKFGRSMNILPGTDIYNLSTGQQEELFAASQMGLMAKGKSEKDNIYFNQKDGKFDFEFGSERIAKEQQKIKANEQRKAAMPKQMPKDWYENFKKTMTAANMPKDGSGITTANLDVLADEKPGLDLYNLNPEQQQAMYEQCKDGIYLAGDNVHDWQKLDLDQSGNITTQKCDYEKVLAENGYDVSQIQEYDVDGKVQQEDKEAKLKEQQEKLKAKQKEENEKSLISDEGADIDDDGPAQEGVDAQLSAAVIDPETLERTTIPITKEQKQAFDVVQKTLTDKYPGAKVDELLNSGQVLDGEGNNFAATKNPYERYQKVFEAMNSENGIYIQDFKSPKGQRKAENVKRDPATGTITKKQETSNVISGALKKDTLESLKKIGEVLTGIDSKNPAFNEFKKKCPEVIEALGKLASDKDFRQVLNQFADMADQYMIKNIGSVNGNMAPNKAMRMQVTSQVSNLRQNVNQNKLPSQNTPTSYDNARKEIAIKYLRAASNVAAQRGTPEQKKLSEQMSHDINVFNKQVDTLLNDPAWNSIYNPNTKEGKERIAQGMNSGCMEVFNNTCKEVLNPSPDRIKGIQQNQMASQQVVQDPNQKVNQQVNPQAMNPAQRKQFLEKQQALKNALKERLEPMDPATLQATKEKVHEMRQKMSNVGGLGQPSVEAQAFQTVLMQVDDAMQDPNFRGNKMQTKQMMDALSNAAKDYYNVKLNDSGQKNRNERVDCAAQIIDLNKDIQNGKNPATNSSQKTELDRKKEILARKIINESAKNFLKSKDPKDKNMGMKLKNDEKEIQKMTGAILESDSFKEAFDSPEAIEKAFNKSPSKLLDMVTSRALEHQKEKDPNFKKKGKDEDVLENKESKDKPENEEIKKDDPATEMVL